MTLHACNTWHYSSHCSQDSHRMTLLITLLTRCIGSVWYMTLHISYTWHTTHHVYTLAMHLVRNVMSNVMSNVTLLTLGNSTWWVKSHYSHYSHYMTHKTRLAYRKQYKDLAQHRDLCTASYATSRSLSLYCFLLDIYVGRCQRHFVVGDTRHRDLCQRHATSRSLSLLPTRQLPTRHRDVCVLHVVCVLRHDTRLNTQTTRNTHTSCDRLQRVNYQYTQQYITSIQDCNTHILSTHTCRQAAARQIWIHTAAYYTW